MTCVSGHQPSDELQPPHFSQSLPIVSTENHHAASYMYRNSSQTAPLEGNNDQMAPFMYGNVDLHPASFMSGNNGQMSHFMNGYNDHAAPFMSHDLGTSIGSALHVADGKNLIVF